MNTVVAGNSGEAKIRYLDADFEVVAPGSFVRCAVTQKPISLEELKYWSVARQEAYIDVEASVTRELEARTSD